MVPFLKRDASADMRPDQRGVSVTVSAVFPGW
jgi:hypothetical protein